MPINCPNVLNVPLDLLVVIKMPAGYVFAPLNYSLHDSFVLESELYLNKIIREIREFSFMVHKSWVLDSRTNIYLNGRLQFGPFFVPDSTWWYDWFGKEFYIGRNLT